MELNITSRHFHATEALKAEASEAAAKLQRFYDGIISTQIILSVENDKESTKFVEFIIRVHDNTIVVKEQTDDFSKSIHNALERVKRQLRKLRTKSERGRYDTVANHIEVPEEEEEF